MKLNKILMAFAAMAMVGCSSEDLNDFSASQAPEDSRLIQLDENFAIAGAGVDDATTRTHWEKVDGKLVNKFLPILTGAYAADEVLANKVDALKQSVGLCWLGETAGPNVYTNYEFYHFGWLKQGEDNATLECKKLTNGAWYDEIKFTAAGGAANAEPATGDFAFVDPATKTFAITALNYNSGVYKTENKAIFGGDYIVYYPFNKDFNEVGTIPAKAVTNFKAATGVREALYLGDATFRYSRKTHIDGGATANGFGLFNLSALVNLQVEGPSGGNIDQIVLYSAKKQLLEQANLAADKIVAGKSGQELYANTTGTKTIVATLATPATSTATVPVKTYISVLPTTVEDLVAYIHREDGTWATKTIGKHEFEENTGKTIHIAVKAADFTAQFIAVDEKSLITARNEARAAGGKKTIQVIGEITLDGTTTGTTEDPTAKQYNFDNVKDANITIKGDAIIVPEDITLVANTNFESDVRVLGKSCCSGTNGGRLEIAGGKLNNVTMEKAEAKTGDYDVINPRVNITGATEFVAGKTFDVKAGNVEVNAAVEHKANINIAEGAKLTVNAGGDLNFMGSTVVNDGTIEVKAAGNFDMTDKDGNATADDGKRMTNNATGKFIHNVDAEVGTAVQSMTQNGEYRCRVNAQIKLDDAFLQWTACSVIEMVDAGVSYNLGTAASIKPEAYKHNGEFIDIEVNTSSETTFNNTAKDDKAIQVRNLTVTAGGLNINFIKSDDGKKQRTLTVNGDMTVKATTTITKSKMITVTDNLTVEGGATLTYKGAKANGGLAVAKDIKVNGATFDAGNLAADVDALDITCANFYLLNTAKAYFGNRTDGAAKNMTVSGTIDNPAGCTFEIKAANQNGAGSVLGWVTCTTLKVGGTFPGSKPKVVN